MLTKEQCEKALDRVARFCSWFSPYKCPECIKLKNELDILDKLIEEHFLNPPLTFEQIESGKPIWDNKNKEWLLVNNALSISSEVKGKSYKKFMKVGYKGRRNFLNVEQCEIDYEPNRFFRKEVVHK